MKRLLITGGSSYLGQHLVPRASEGHELIYTYFDNDPLGHPRGAWLDIRDAGSVSNLVNEWQPEVIIHTAGSNRSRDMEAVIIHGAKNIVHGAMQTGARLIHISTDVIFDGTQGPYKETDLPTPVHPYGRAKTQAEEVVSSWSDHVILRTSLIYDLMRMDLSTTWIVSALQKGEPVTLFSDQLRNPVWSGTLSSACLELCQRSFTGIMHVAGHQQMSRAEFGLKMLDWWRVENREGLHIGPSQGNWPMDCRLDISLASELLDTPLLGVDEVLRTHGELGHG